MSQKRAEPARFAVDRAGSEKRASFTASSLMFCVMGGYFAVRPMRETIGTILGEAVTRDPWIWTAVFAIPSSRCTDGSWRA